MITEQPNPFVLDFGRIPPQFIPRVKPMNDVIQAFSEKSSTNRARMITGVRGCGKTVFLTAVCKHFRSEKDWIVLDISPEMDIVESLAGMLMSEQELAAIFTYECAHDTRFESTENESDFQTLLVHLLDCLQEHRMKLLIVIDEVTNAPSLRRFASVFQTVLQHNDAVYVLMAGLFENIEALKRQQACDVFSQIPVITLGPLNMGRMADSFASVFQLPTSQALMMAKETCGYAYAFQVLGYLTWKHSDHPDQIQSQYRQYLEEYVYEKVWSDLSCTEQRVTLAIAQTSDGSMGAIRKRLRMSSHQFSLYRARLIQKGIINGEIYGHVHFTLPLFSEYVLENAGINDDAE